MKRKLHLFFGFLFLAVAARAPGFAVDAPERAVKPSLDAVGTFRRAAALAESYGLEVLVEDGDWGRTDFVAYDRKSGYGVAYFYKYIKSAQRIVEFCYYNLDGEAESEIRIYEGDGLLSLRNSFELADFSSGTHYMPFDLYRKYTRHLVAQREIIKAEYAEKYGITFFEVINPAQPRVRRDAGARIFVEE